MTNDGAFALRAKAFSPRADFALRWINNRLEVVKTDEGCTIIIYNNNELWKLKKTTL